ncbi:MAG: Ig-like domain-containing protein, partial [Oscillospiraceae bacterium]|nr:Ig-like domain-containing protein [Oscillospiraceae bacterium]
MDPQNLLGVELSAGEHSLIIIPATNNAFVHKLDFTPAYEPAKISEISASVESSEIFVGVEQNISFSATPSVSMWYDIERGKTKFDGSTGALGAVAYSGYDANIVSVSADGKLTALAPGNTTITVTAMVNGEALTDTIDITVKLPVVSDVNVVAPRYILVADADGEALGVTAKMTDGADVDMTKATVTYESLTPKFADVSAEGIVTPKKEGTAEIKVTVTYEGVSAFATVEIPITKESLPDGSRFVIDFGTVDISTAYTEDDVRYYARAITRGANWSLDVANTTSNKYYDNGVQGIRVAQPGLTSF